MSVALRRVFVVALSLAVFAGGAGGVVARQMRGADADPHDGVARAHKMPVQGIDVSNWQGDIDWDKVRAAGTQFAFIKATEGGDYLDPKFAQNWQAAKRAGKAWERFEAARTIRRHPHDQSSPSGRST